MARRIYSISRSRLDQLEADFEARLAAEAPTLCTLGQQTLRSSRPCVRPSPYDRPTRPARRPPSPPSSSSSSSSSSSYSSSSSLASSETLEATLEHLGQCLERMDRRLQEQNLPIRQRLAV